MPSSRSLLLVACALAALTSPIFANGPSVKQDPHLASAGPLCFGPDGILFASDPRAAALLAIQTGDVKKDRPGAIEVENLQNRLAGLLGTKTDEVRIVDLAVNPASGQAYLSVARGRGPDGHGALVRVRDDGELELLDLSKLETSRTTLDFAPEDREIQRGRRKINPRLESITDLAFVNGRVLVAGLSTEEFSSTLRSLPYPFDRQDKPASIRIYHGAHGKYETHSPVRTFLPYEIDGKMAILAAYTCTPLVKIPVEELEPGSKVTGTTIAELGNWNRPLDMISYEKKGERFLLVANSARGIMKFAADGIGQVKPITTRVERGGQAGLKYETIESWKGIEQLDRLDEAHALVVRKSEEGALSLETKPLP